MSILGVLASVAIGGIAMMGITQVIVTSNNANKQILFSQSATTIRQGLIGLLSDRSVCEANFGPASVGGAVSPSTNLPVRTQIVNSLGGLPFLEVFGPPANVAYENGAVRILSFGFQGFRPSDATGARGLTDLVIQFQSSVPLGGPREIFRSVSLVAELTGPGGAITTCVAVGNDDDDIWRLAPNGNIFYLGNNVGIGTNAPTDTLHVVGNVLVSGGTLSAGSINAEILNTGTVTAQAYLYKSDERLKTDFQPVLGLPIIKHLRGVQFRWKKTNRESLGVLAQEIEKVIPTAVTSDPTTGFKLVDYAQITAPLIEAVKELALENEKLQLKLESMNQEILRLEFQGLRAPGGPEN